MGYTQKENAKGYRIDGEDIVFTFHIDDYKYLTNETYQKRVRAKKIDINSVAVAGEFNLWSRDLWQMHKVSETTYEFRKKIADFTDAFDWQFKFVINGNYWAEPSEDVPNIVDAVSESGHPLHVYNLRIYSAYPSKTGNATFKLKGHKDAKRVILSGTFNRWDESLFHMTPTEDGWELTLQLRPDLYEYKFIVDGEWMEDPNNPSKKLNEFHGYNSLIDIQKQVTFNLYGFEDAERVILSGVFNDWSEDAYKMTKTEKGWSYSMPLSRGKYHYKFIVDGKWIVDPNNTVKEYDYKGNINSVCMVK